MRKALILISATAACVLGAWVWLYADVVRRHSRVVDDLVPYGDELRRLPPYDDSPSIADARQYSGPGWYPRRSPNGTRVAVTTSWSGLLGAVGDLLLGLVVDRPHIHTVNVWDETTESLVPVVSIKEADPHSGIAHRYAWSKDSKALLIHGGGRLPEDYDEVLELCVVYLPETDALYRLTNCPPLWQRGVVAEGAVEQ